MLHRHLGHQQFTLAAIDDIIARGKRQDWAELRRAALADRGILEGAHFLAKPLHLDTLLRKVREVLLDRTDAGRAPSQEARL